MSVCTICGHSLHGDRATWTTCQACQTRITGQLADVEQMWPQLTDCLEPTRGHSGPRVSGSVGWRLPAPEEVLNLIGPGGIPTRLYLRYADVALARGLQPQRKPAGADATLAVAVRGIRRHLGWAVQAVDLTLVSTVLSEDHTALTRVTGGADTTPTIPCPAELPDDASRCTGRLRYDPVRRTAACHACGTRLDPSEWLGYWVELGQPQLG